MAVEIRMPKLGMMEGDIQLVEWKKAEGDSIEKGEAIASVEGQKVVNDIEVKGSGIVLKILVEAGDEVPIGTLLAVVGEEGEDISQLLANEAPEKEEEIKEAAPVEKAAPTVAAAKKDDGDFIRSSPAAKRVAKANNIDLADVVAALNISGRVQGEDVERYIDEGHGQTVVSGNFTDTKLVGMRKTIAERMGQSSRETAPVVLMRSVDITDLYNLRKKKKEEYQAKGEKAPSFNDVIIKAVALALEDHPRLNATFEGDTIRTYDDINTNMAMAVDEGLITPVIYDTNTLTVDEISVRTKEFSEKASKNQLTAADYSGGTFTVTNLGMVDIEVSTPILNPPQVGILAVGTIHPYLVMEEGQVVERHKTYFSLTVDHRIVDGYPGALYLKTLAEILQNPEQLY